MQSLCHLDGSHLWILWEYRFPFILILSWPFVLRRSIVCRSSAVRGSDRPQNRTGLDSQAMFFPHTILLLKTVLFLKITFTIFYCWLTIFSAFQYIPRNYLIWKYFFAYEINPRARVSKKASPPAPIACHVPFSTTNSSENIEKTKNNLNLTRFTSQFWHCFHQDQWFKTMSLVPGSLLKTMTIEKAVFSFIIQTYICKFPRNKLNNKPIGSVYKFLAKAVPSSTLPLSFHYLIYHISKMWVTYSGAHHFSSLKLWFFFFFGSLRSYLHSILIRPL